MKLSAGKKDLSSIQKKDVEELPSWLSMSIFCPLMPGKKDGVPAIKTSPLTSSVENKMVNPVMYIKLPTSI